MKMTESEASNTSVSAQATEPKAPISTPLTPQADEGGIPSRRGVGGAGLPAAGVKRLVVAGLPKGTRISRPAVVHAAALLDVVAADLVAEARQRMDAEGCRTLLPRHFSDALERTHKRWLADHLAGNVATMRQLLERMSQLHDNLAYELAKK